MAMTIHELLDARQRREISRAEYVAARAAIEEGARRRDLENRRLSRRRRLQDTDAVCPYRTLKAAYADGWRDLAPQEYGGERLRLRGHTLVKEPSVALSQTEWCRRGFRVKPGEQPHATVSGRRSSWAVYRADQVSPKRRITAKPATTVDVLAAVWAINRAAKRRRDAATKCYAAEAHTFASQHSNKKEDYYQLKAQALHYLLADGRIRVVGHHVFEWRWAEVLAGEGYVFHRPCPQQSGEAIRIEQVEAKPRECGEPRLTDALHTLERYLAGRPTVQCYQWPARRKPARPPESRVFAYPNPDQDMDDLDEDDDF